MVYDGGKQLALREGADLTFKWAPEIKDKKKQNVKVHEAIAYEIWSSKELWDYRDDITVWFKEKGVLWGLGKQLKIDVVPIGVVYKRVVEGITNTKH